MAQMTHGLHVSKLSVSHTHPNKRQQRLQQGLFWKINKHCNKTSAKDLYPASSWSGQDQGWPFRQLLEITEAGRGGCCFDKVEEISSVKKDFNSLSETFWSHWNQFTEKKHCVPATHTQAYPHTPGCVWTGVEHCRRGSYMLVVMEGWQCQRDNMAHKPPWQLRASAQLKLPAAHTDRALLAGRLAGLSGFNARIVPRKRCAKPFILNKPFTGNSRDETHKMKMCADLFNKPMQKESQVQAHIKCDWGHRQCQAQIRMIYYADF